MKHKLLKRIFILTQVLGLSALAATACTDNNSNSSAKTSASTSSATATTQVKTEETNQPTDSNQNLQQNPEHKDDLKQKAIKAGAAVLKGTADTVIAAGAVAASINNPAKAANYAKAAKEAISAVNHKVNDLKEKAVAKEENKKAQSEGDDSSNHHVSDALKKAGSKLLDKLGKKHHEQTEPKP